MSPSFQGGNANSDTTSFTPSNSSSSSSSSSLSLQSQSLKTFSAPKKSMEEVWRDINLSCLQDTSKNTTANIILQDFLAPPSRKHQSPAAQVFPADDLIMSSRPATMLNLNSSSEFQYIANEISTTRHPHFNGRTEPFPSPGAGLFSPAVSNIFKKTPQNQDHSSSDRRHMRMIKNRESAARSRARKQAYTQELEMEVNRLREENARLRKQQENVLPNEIQITRKKKLYRTSTAPF